MQVQFCCSISYTIGHSIIPLDQLTIPYTIGITNQLLGQLCNSNDRYNSKTPIIPFPFLRPCPQGKSITLQLLNSIKFQLQYNYWTKQYTVILLLDTTIHQCCDTHYHSILLQDCRATQPFNATTFKFNQTQQCTPQQYTRKYSDTPTSPIHQLQLYHSYATLRILSFPSQNLAHKVRKSKLKLVKRFPSCIFL